MVEDGQPKKLKVHYKAVEGGEEFQGEYNTVCSMLQTYKKI
jgi:hypothetical protein